MAYLVGFIIKKFVTMHGHINVKLVYLVGFIIKKFVTMHGHINVKLVHLVGFIIKKSVHLLVLLCEFYIKAWTRITL